MCLIKSLVPHGHLSYIYMKIVEDSTLFKKLIIFSKKCQVLLREYWNLKKQETSKYFCASNSSVKLQEWISSCSDVSHPFHSRSRTINFYTIADILYARRKVAVNLKSFEVSECLLCCLSCIVCR